MLTAVSDLPMVCGFGLKTDEIVSVSPTCRGDTQVDMALRRDRQSLP